MLDARCLIDKKKESPDLYSFQKPVSSISLLFAQNFIARNLKYILRSWSMQTAGSMTENKVFVIGLDGATWDLIEPWADAGKLPHLAEIMATGAFGKLRSTIHPLTAPAWTSFMTGKNPGQHGIFDFISLSPNSYNIRYNNALSCKSASLWKILSQADRKVISVNVPFTFPPEKVNGILISGLDTPSTKSPFTYPPDLAEEIKRHVGEYVIMAQYRNGRRAYVSEIFRMIDNRAATVNYLMDKKPWDFFMVVFSATDVVGHTFWKYMDASHPQHVAREAAEYGDVILRVYQKMDQIIGRLLARLDDQTTLIIMSDHGFGPLYKAVYLNKWLEQENLLKPVAPSRNVSRAGHPLKGILGRCKKYTPRGMKDLAIRFFPELKAKVDSYLVASHIDWSHTKAFSFGVHGSIFINLAGRQPMGIVQPGREYEDVRTGIITRLSQLTDPENGVKVVERVYRREELYHGDFLHLAPDLLVEWKDYSYTGQQDYGEDIESVFQSRSKFAFSEKEHNGSHRLDGVFMMHGGAVKRGVELQGCHIVDLAPTILHLMGMSIPEDMDGKVLTSAMADDYTAMHPIGYGGAAAHDVDEVISTYSSDEAQRIENRLKDLGYL
jgi:predicted AlkP superfamily phosphohydrolase/phosphomutase